MNAAFFEGDGQFAVREGRIVPPGPGEVRLQVAYCGICGTDLHIYHGAMAQRLQLPQVIGHEMSGTVAEVGEGVEGFAIGDAVVVRPLDTSETVPADKGFPHVGTRLKFMGIDTPGAFQGSWTVPAFTLHHLPKGIDMKLAALVEPVAVACHDVRRARLTADEQVVVLGGGPIGLLVALVARETGADVLLSEVNPRRLELAESLGLATANPTEEDVKEIVMERTEGAGADVVFEVSGATAAAAQMTELACIRGRICLVAIHPEPVPVDLFRFFWRELELLGARVYEPEDFDRAIELVAAEALPLEPLITAVEPLEGLQQAFRQLSDDPEAMKILIACS